MPHICDGGSGRRVSGHACPALLVNTTRGVTVGTPELPLGTAAGRVVTSPLRLVVRDDAAAVAAATRAETSTLSSRGSADRVIHTVVATCSVQHATDPQSLGVCTDSPPTAFATSPPCRSAAGVLRRPALPARYGHLPVDIRLWRARARRPGANDGDCAAVPERGVGVHRRRRRRHPAAVQSEDDVLQAGARRLEGAITRTL